jgi:hypothetical protein
MRSRENWRLVLARLPLPMLALAAAYGVYKFNMLFVPMWVALVSAAAFELVYVGLSVARLDVGDRRRASVIAGAAVAVSVVYNSLAALFEIRPALLDARPLWADIALAILHGLPLAILAWNVAQLLLHQEQEQVAEPALARQVDYPPPVLVEEAGDQGGPLCPRCGTAITQREYMASRRWGDKWKGCATCRR